MSVGFNPMVVQKPPALSEFVEFKDGCMVTLPVDVIKKELVRLGTYELLSTRLNQLMQSCFALDDLHDEEHPNHFSINLELCRGYFIFYFKERTRQDLFSFSKYMISHLSGMIYIADTPYFRAGKDHYFNVYNVCVDPEARGRKIMTKMMYGLIQTICFLKMPFYLQVDI